MKPYSCACDVGEERPMLKRRTKVANAKFIMLFQLLGMTRWRCVEQVRGKRRRKVLNSTGQKDRALRAAWEAMSQDLEHGHLTTPPSRIQYHAFACKRGYVMVRHLWESRFTYPACLDELLLRSREHSGKKIFHAWPRNNYSPSCAFQSNVKIKTSVCWTDISAQRQSCHALARSGSQPKSAIHQIAFPTKSRTSRTLETYKTNHVYNNKFMKLGILLRNILYEFSTSKKLYIPVKDMVRRVEKKKGAFFPYNEILPGLYVRCFVSKPITYAVESLSKLINDRLDTCIQRCDGYN